MGSSSTTTTTVAAEKTIEELKREIEELNHQQREISDRIRDPRGLRHGGLAAHNNGPPQNFRVNGGATAVRQRGFVTLADRYEDQPAPKRRLSSAAVKVKEDGELTEDVPNGVQDVKEKESTPKSDANGNDITVDNDRKPSYLP